MAISVLREFRPTHTEGVFAWPQSCDGKGHTEARHALWRSLGCRTTRSSAGNGTLPAFATHPGVCDEPEKAPTRQPTGAGFEAGVRD